MPYPPPPGPRVAYDLDGTVALIQDMTTREMFDVHPRALAALNSQDSALVDEKASSSERYWVSNAESVNLTLLFPEPLRLYGLYRSAWSESMVSLPEVQTSSNSTNGVDGDWTTIVPIVTNVLYAGGSSTGLYVTARSAVLGNSQGYGLGARPYYRNERAGDTLFGWEALGGGVATRNVRAVRISRRQTYSPGAFGRGTGVNLHLYGEPDTLASNDRLSLWRPAVNLPLAAGALDWGDTPQGSSAEKTFRVKNLSATRTAEDVLVDALPGAPTGAPPVDGMILFSLDDGETWEPTVTIVSLSPGATSGVIRMRRVVPTNAELGPYSPRVAAQTGEWS